jgi:NAD(P)H-hydrate epimerase
MTAWYEPALSAAEMREAEGTYPGPTVELMERAGRECAQSALRHFPDARRWTVRCGPGANGGDGFVVARELHQRGRQVEVVLAGDPGAIVGDSAVNLARLSELGVPVTDGMGRSDAIVDALFGTGFHGEPRPSAAEAIAEINGAGVPVLAVDLPSGVDASTGETMGVAVDATVTVTFHARKVGHVLAPGRFHCGRVEIADIGLGPCQSGATRVATEASVGLVPRRGETDNKYTAGAVLVIGGSAGLTGAPCLTAAAAHRTGAGIVWACVPASLSLVFEQRLLEVMTVACPDDSQGRLKADAAGPILTAARRAGAVVLGPGLGRSAETRKLVHDLLAGIDVPLVVDADALWALGDDLSAVRERNAPTVLTPHAGELARLLGRNSADIGAHRLEAAQTAAKHADAVVLLKGADTIVVDASPDVLVSDLGTPGLATAGTGDVLAGVITALLAKQMETKLAAVVGSALNGLAARTAGARAGEPGLLASDIVWSISPTLAASPQLDCGDAPIRR